MKKPKNVVSWLDIDKSNYKIFQIYSSPCLVVDYANDRVFWDAHGNIIGEMDNNTWRVAWNDNVPEKARRLVREQIKMIKEGRVRFC